jgi:hypothetical protein
VPFNSEINVRSVKNIGSSKMDVYVDVSVFSVTHVDTGAEDGLGPDDENAEHMNEPASQLHLTQVHNIAVRISQQLNLLRGEQRYYRHRCVARTF